MKKKDVRKTMIEASGQPFFKDKTNTLGYITANNDFNFVSDILKEINYTNNCEKGNYVKEKQNDCNKHIINASDIQRKLKVYKHITESTNGCRFVTQRQKDKMLTTLIDIANYANLGIQLWFDHYGENE